MQEEVMLIMHLYDTHVQRSMQQPTVPIYLCDVLRLRDGSENILGYQSRPECWSPKLAQLHASSDTTPWFGASASSREGSVNFSDQTRSQGLKLDHSVILVRTVTITLEQDRTLA